MSSGEWSAVRRAFLEAMDVPEELRTAFVERRCADDPELLFEVESLLQANAAEDGFLVSPHSGAFTELLAGGFAHLAPGTEVGNYRIERVLGEGGMGTVYAAVQARPRRKVALKMMRCGLASESAIRRFRYEAELLGQLRHPGIAHVYEAGVHRQEHGGRTVERPYFALEFVEGAGGLLEHARERGLDERARIELFLEVAAAVEYGHQQGIIHRDLKPGNVLVDEAGRPRVIDFGIARATAPGRTEGSLQTDAGQRTGTLAYMSPDRIAGDSSVADTRSDVYALGCILFELLVGRFPFEIEETPLHEAARILCEETPRMPDSLPRELGWIACKALEKEPQRRYASVGELARDLRAYLAGEAVLAGPPSRVYRLRKLLVRHRASVALALAVPIALTVGLIRAENARATAERARADALAQADKARATLAFFEDSIHEVDPWRSGSDVRLVEVLEIASEAFDPGGEPYPETEAAMRSTIGTAFDRLGLPDRALEHLERSLALYRATRGDDDPDTLEVELSLARVLRKGGGFERAEELERHVLAAYRRALGDGDRKTLHATAELGRTLRIAGRRVEAETMIAAAYADHVAHLGESDLDTLDCATELANVYEQQGRTQEAEELLLHAIDGLRRHHEGQERMALLWERSLAHYYLRWGRVEEAAVLLEASIATSLEVFGANHPAHLDTRRLLGDLRREQGRLEEADALLTEVLESLRDVTGGRDGYALEALNGLAMTRQYMGRPAEAGPLFEEALELSREVWGPDHPYTLVIAENLAMLWSGIGANAEAEVLQREVLTQRIHALGRDHDATGQAAYVLAEVVARQGRPEEACAIYADAVSEDARAGSARASDVRLLLPWGRCLRRLGRFEEAEERLLAAYGALDDSAEVRSRYTRPVAAALVGLYEAWGRAEDALELRRRHLDDSAPGAADPVEGHLAD